MRFELHHPGADTSERPLVGDVEALDAARGRSEERDGAILDLLRDKLRGRHTAPDSQSGAKRKPASEAGTEDKYEPQRISRKICWQYDQSARKIPMLRRHYI